MGHDRQRAALGGQAIGPIIGTIIELFTHGKEPSVYDVDMATLRERLHDNLERQD